MNVDFVDDVKLLVKQCQLNKLLEQIDDAEKRIRSFGKNTKHLLFCFNV